MRSALKILLFLLLLTLFFGEAGLIAQPREGDAPGQKKKLVVGVTHDPPYLVKEKNGQWTGLNVEIWKGIARDLNIDYDFREMTFNELIGALKGGTVDVSIEAFFLLSERQRLFDYSVAFGNTRLALAALPDKISHPWWTAIKIFLSWGTLQTVGLLCLILCILGFFLWVIERKTNPDHFGGGPIQGIAAGVYWVGSTLASGVCFGVALKSFPARIIGLIWMLVCAIALSALIASLTSSLSESRAMTELVSEETLRHMRLAGVEESAESIVLKNLGGDHVLYPTATQALQAVLAREVDAMLYDEITLSYLEDNAYRGKISIYPTTSRRFMFALGLPKNSPWLNGVNQSLLTAMESRDWRFLLKKYGVEQSFEQGGAAKTGMKARGR